MIDSFTGDYKFLSNFYPSNILFDSIFYPTAEHAYQAMKTLDKLDRLKISEFSTPGLAKRYGQKVTLRPNWDRIRIYIMYDIVSTKFTTHKDLLQLLIETGDEELVEGNDWGDYYWGYCNGRGFNHLGQILMAVRNIQNKQQ